MLPGQGPPLQGISGAMTVRQLQRAARGLNAVKTVRLNAVRTFATSAMNMRTADPNVPVTSLIPPAAPLRVHPPSPEQERETFDQAVRDVEAWLASPRWNGIKVRFAH